MRKGIFGDEDMKRLGTSGQGEQYPEGIRYGVRVIPGFFLEPQRNIIELDLGLIMYPVNPTPAPGRDYAPGSAQIGEGGQPYASR
jgi:hypothetical protein